MASIAVTIVRALLGLLFVVFGLTGLIMLTTGSGLLPMPPAAPAMAAWSAAMFQAGYLLPLVKVLEVAGGLMLLTGRYPRLGIVLLAPIVVNILGTHLALDPAGAPMALGLTAMTAFLIYHEWNFFRGVFAYRTTTPYQGEESHAQHSVQKA